MSTLSWRTQSQVPCGSGSRGANYFERYQRSMQFSQCAATKRLISDTRASQGPFLVSIHLTGYERAAYLMNIFKDFYESWVPKNQSGYGNHRSQVGTPQSFASPSQLSWQCQRPPQVGASRVNGSVQTTSGLITVRTVPLLSKSPIVRTPRQVNGMTPQKSSSRTTQGSSGKKRNGNKLGEEMKIKQVRELAIQRFEAAHGEGAYHRRKTIRPVSDKLYTQREKKFNDGAIIENLKIAKAVHIDKALEKYLDGVYRHLVHHCALHPGKVQLRGRAGFKSADTYIDVQDRDSF